MPGLAVVVPTFRRTGGLRRLVEALSAQDLPSDEWELIVVDDGSGAPWAEEADAVIATAPFAARVIHSSANGGPAVARNIGWRSSDAGLVAFTDDDCTPVPQWLSAGRHALLGNPDIGVLQGPTVRPPGSEHYDYTCLTVVREVHGPSPWFEGCNLFLTRDALEAAGGFDETLRMHGEETALGWSVLEAGWQRGWAPDAVVVHELVDRPWRWHLRIHFLERHLVVLAARHPGLRSCFWRPWAVKRENALFALAAAGAVLAAAGRPARKVGTLLVLPYAIWLFPPWRRPMSLRGAAHQVSLHAASLLGKAVAGVTERTLIL